MLRGSLVELARGRVEDERRISNRGPTSASWTSLCEVFTKTWCLRPHTNELVGARRKGSEKVGAPERDKVALVNVGHRSLAVVPAREEKPSARSSRLATGDLLGHREAKLECVPYSTSQRATESSKRTPSASISSHRDKIERLTLEDQMRVLLAHRRSLHVTQTVPKHDARKRKEDGWTMREVRKHERVGYAAVLVEDDEVGDSVCTAGVGELLHDVVSAVDASRVGEAEAHFLGEERGQFGLSGRRQGEGRGWCSKKSREREEGGGIARRRKDPPWRTERALKRDRAKS